MEHVVLQNFQKLKQRLLTIYCFLFFAFAALLYAIPMAWVYQLLWPHNERKKLQYHKRFCRMFAWMGRHIPGVDIVVEGLKPDTFAKPCIVVCNHQSHLDLLSLLMLSPRLCAMTNQWVWNFPLYAPVIRYMEYYPAARGVEENQEHIAGLLGRGYSVIIFPEGTRTATGKINKFRRGAFFLAEQLGADIQPVYLEGAYDVLPKTDFCLRRGTIRVKIGERVAATDTSMGSNYREKTRQWHQRYLEYESQL